MLHRKMGPVTDAKPHTDSPRPYPALAFGCGVTLAAVVIGTVFSIELDVAIAALSRVSGGAIPRDLTIHPASMALGDLVVLGTVLVLGTAIARAPLRDVFPLRRFSPWVIPALVSVALGSSFLVSEVVNLLYVVLPMPAWLETLFDDVFGGGRGLVATILWVAALGPVLEELMFRGLVLHVLLRRYSPWVAIVISSALFAAIHLNPWQAPGAFGGGLLLGWIVVKTRSLWPCVIVHALFNGLHYLWQLLAMDIPGYTSAPPEGALLQPLWLDAFGLGFLVLGLGLLAVATRRAASRGTERPEEQSSRESLFRG